jgi:hypothetical protein
MLHRHSTACPASRGSFRVEPRVPAIVHVRDSVAVRHSRLHDHLVREHGRTAREIAGLPLADLHRFEHVEQDLGLNTLSHRHAIPLKLS